MVRQGAINEHSTEVNWRFQGNEMNVFFLGLFLAMIAITLWVFGQGSKRQRYQEENGLARAISKHIVVNDDPRLRFDPRTAVLVSEHVMLAARGSPEPLESSCIFRNDAGEYFLFLFKLGTPGVLTYLSKERAKNALRFDPEIFASEFPNES
jgi:hypothetical protein